MIFSGRVHVFNIKGWTDKSSNILIVMLIWLVLILFVFDVFFLTFIYFTLLKEQGVAYINSSQWSMLPWRIMEYKMPSYGNWILQSNNLFCTLYSYPPNTTYTALLVIPNVTLLLHILFQYATEMVSHVSVLHKVILCDMHLDEDFILPALFDKQSLKSDTSLYLMGQSRAIYVTQRD